MRTSLKAILGASVALGIVIALPLLAQSIPAPQASLYTRTFNAHANGWTVDDHNALAQAWQGIGDPARALPYWENALRVQPSLNVARVLSETYLVQADYARALDSARIALTLNPNEVWANAYVAFLLAPSFPQEALPHLRTLLLDETYGTLAQNLLSLIQEAPEERAFVRRVGAIFLEAQAWAFAESAFLHAVTVNYPDSLATVYIGWVQDQQSKDGSEWIEEAVRLAPDNADVRFIQGLHLRQQGAYEESAIALEIAVALNPDPVFYTEIAALYDLMGLPDVATSWRDRLPK